jgi:hypothetical protein
MANSPDTLKAMLNQDFPISLKEIDPLINRIYERYPHLTHYEIVSIVKKFFETIRYLLLTGNIISFNTLIPRMQLLTFKKNINGIYRLVNKMKLSTPKKMKK